MSTSPSSGASGSDSGKPRRLGRGLSSLLGEPVQVNLSAAPTPMPPAASPAIPPAPSPSPIAVAPSAATRSTAPPATARAGGIAEPKPHVVAKAIKTSGSAGIPVSGVSTAMVAPPPTSDAQPAVRAQTPRAAVGGAASDIRQIESIPVAAIEANRFQPRRAFDQVQLEELAASIRTAGVMQPVLVRPLRGPVGGRYELVAGERRLRAAKIAGLASIPAVVAELSDEQSAEWALIENVQRSDLSPMERAYALKGLCTNFRLSHAEAADKLGMERSSVTNLIRLTELDDRIIGLIEDAKLSIGHGKLLLGIASAESALKLAQRAADAGWSVRKLEQAIAAEAGVTDGKAAGVVAAAKRDAIASGSLAAAGLKELEKQLSDHLGTRVKIRPRKSGTKGTMVVQFYDLDHFDGLMAKMGFVMR